VFKQLFSFGHDEDSPELILAIDRAISKVEPLLKQSGAYPSDYRKPVIAGLKYAHSLAMSVPGPLILDGDAYAQDRYVHAIFPSKDFIEEAFRSSLAMQNYLSKNSSGGCVYALMGMRRHEKTMMGMELLGQVVQHDVAQHVVYFTGHTLENAAPDEPQARELMAWSFFDSLVDKVAKRVDERKQELQSQRQETDMLMARMHVADAEQRPAMKEELSSMLSEMQDTTRALNLRHYLDDFEAVMFNPERYLRLKTTPMILDNMGIRRKVEGMKQGYKVVFSDLIGFDRRDWAVILVCARDIKTETFTDRLDTAYRRLSI